ncbi:MAG: hypothetical protein DRG78_04485 [Epsilonproteobacteria bacterium]|nr:MAG: hypothetical protein DRG78_04485 [Campylobacterota bacterium]
MSKWTKFDVECKKYPQTEGLVQYFASYTISEDILVVLWKNYNPTTTDIRKLQTLWHHLGGETLEQYIIRGN